MVLKGYVALPLAAFSATDSAVPWRSFQCRCCRPRLVNGTLSRVDAHHDGCVKVGFGDCNRLAAADDGPSPGEVCNNRHVRLHSLALPSPVGSKFPSSSDERHSRPTQRGHGHLDDDPEPRVGIRVGVPAGLDSCYWCFSISGTTVYSNTAGRRIDSRPTVTGADVDHDVRLPPSDLSESSRRYDPNHELVIGSRTVIVNLPGDGVRRCPHPVIRRSVVPDAASVVESCRPLVHALCLDLVRGVVVPVRHVHGGAVVKLTSIICHCTVRIRPRRRSGSVSSVRARVALRFLAPGDIAWMSPKSRV